MKLLKKILNSLCNCLITADNTGDMAKHRLHTTKYEDLCK